MWYGVFVVWYSVGVFVMWCVFVMRYGAFVVWYGVFMGLCFVRVCYVFVVSDIRGVVCGCDVV